MISLVVRIHVSWTGLIIEQTSKQTTQVQLVVLLTLLRSSYVPVTSTRPLSDFELQEDDQISD